MDRLTPSRRDWLAVAFVIVAVSWPFLGSPRAQFGDDDLEYAVPFSNFVLSELGHGRWPSWNPATDGGLPLLAQQPWMGPIYPGLALFALLPDGWALSAGYAVHAALYAVGVLLLLRRLGFRLEGALAGALAIGLGSDVAVAWNRGYLHHLVSVAWLPWPILAFESARAGKHPWRSAARGAMALGLAFLGGHTVSALQTALAFGVWSGTSIALDAGRAVRARGPGRWLPALRSIGIACVIAFGAAGLAAVQLVPLREMASTGTLPEQRIWKPWDLEMASPWRKVGYLLPAWETGHKGRDFVGITTLLLAVVGLARLIVRPPPPEESSPSNTEDRARDERFDSLAAAAPALATALVAALLSMGSHAPFFGWAASVFPPLGVISYPYFFSPATHLGIAWLAAAGVSALASERLRAPGLAALSVGVVLAGVVVLVLRARIASDPLDHGGLARSVPFVIAPLAAFLLAMALHWKRAIGEGRYAGWVVALTLIEITSYRIRARLEKPLYSTATYFHVDDPLVRALSRSPSHGRIWHVERTRPVADWLLRRNGGLMLGYEEINRSSRVGSMDYRDATRALGSDLEWESALAESDLDSGHAARAATLCLDDAQTMVLDTLAVDRLVTDLPLSGTRASEFVHELDDASGMVHLYRRRTPAPRFGLALGQDAHALVIPESRFPGGVSLDVTLDRDAWIVARENYDGAVALEIEGLAPRRPNSQSESPAFFPPAVVVSVPAGQHHVTIRYVPPRWPALLSLACWVGMIGVAGRRS